MFYVDDALYSKVKVSGGKIKEMPNSVKRIDNFAFEYCQIEKVNYLGTIEEWCEIIFTSPSSNPFFLGASLSLDGVVVKDLVIPDMVTTINDYAFYRFMAAESIIIPNSVKSIGNNAFYNCSSLESIAIPDSVESIGNDAFNECVNLNYVTISSSVKNIGESAFCLCSNLASVMIQNGVESIEKTAFLNCSSLSSIIIPDSVERIEEAAFLGCTNLKNVYIESDIVANGIIAADSFGNIVENATAIYIEESITTIGSYIIDNYTKSSSTTINGVTYNIYTK